MKDKRQEAVEEQSPLIRPTRGGQTTQQVGHSLGGEHVPRQFDSAIGKTSRSATISSNGQRPSAYRIETTTTTSQQQRGRRATASAKAAKEEAHKNAKEIRKKYTEK